MNTIRFKKNDRGFYRLAESSQNPNLQILASFITDSTHIHASEDVLANKKLDVVCGNMYCVSRENPNKISIEYGIFQDGDSEREALILDENTFAYLINTWETLNKKRDVSEITITYSDGKYEMTGK